MKIFKITFYLTLKLIIVSFFIACEKDDNVSISQGKENLSIQNNETNNNEIKKVVAELNSLVFEKDDTLQMVPLNTYKVIKGKLIETAKFDAPDNRVSIRNKPVKFNRLISLIEQLVPTEILTNLEQIILYSASTDIGGFVTPKNEYLNKWYLGINISVAYINDIFDNEGIMSETIIHEIGHIATLYNPQVNPNIKSEDCTNYYLSAGDKNYGCIQTNSYFDINYKKYWKDIEEDFENLDNDFFYELNEERFVSPEASVSPTEDVAESFVEFIKSQKPYDTTQIKNKKIRLFYNDSRFVKIRNSIRSKKPDFLNLKSAKGLKFLNHNTSTHFKNKMCVH